MSESTHAASGTEAHDFTPWLASEENLPVLANTLGMELELEAQEFSIGRAEFCLEARLHSAEKWIAVHLVMQGPNATAHFGLLERQREEIGRELPDIEWRPSREKTEQHVRLCRNNADSTRQDDWPNQIDWMVSTLEDFGRVFRPRVKFLDASDWRPDEGRTEN